MKESVLSFDEKNQHNLGFPFFQIAGNTKILF